MNYENFNNILNAIRKIDTFVDKASDLNIDLFDTPLFDGIMTLEKELLTQTYTEEGYDWIMWYLYDLPSMQEKNLNGEDNKEPYAWDKYGNPIVLNTDRELWLMLEKDYNEE